LPESVVTLLILNTAGFLGASVCWGNVQCWQARGRWPLTGLFLSAHFSCLNI